MNIELPIRCHYCGRHMADYGRCDCGRMVRKPRPSGRPVPWQPERVTGMCETARDVVVNGYLLSDSNF